MVPHREHEELALANTLFNRKLCRGRGVVENAFALLKQSFCELLLKTDLDVTFIPDMVMCCGILHNILLKQSTQDVEMLLNVLREEGCTEDAKSCSPDSSSRNGTRDGRISTARRLGEEKRIGVASCPTAKSSSVMPSVHGPVHP